MNEVEVKIKILDYTAVIPAYAKQGDMGMDLTATDLEYDAKSDCFIYHTGLAMEVPDGYGVLIFPRSSNRRTNAYMTNHVGVIDSGYRGEILVCFKMRDREMYSTKMIKESLDDIAPYKVGERIAQMIVFPYPKVTFKEVCELSDSERGTGGHGSTGK